MAQADALASKGWAFYGTSGYVRLRSVQAACASSGKSKRYISTLKPEIFQI